MLKRKTRNHVTKVPARELLAVLPKLELEKRQLSRQLQEIPLDIQLLSLCDISIEREIEGFKEILTALGKL